MKRLCILLALLPSIAAPDLLVKFRPNVGELSKHAILVAHGNPSGKVLKVHKLKESYPGVKQRLEAMSGVEWVEEDERVEPALVPNDPEYTSSYHYWDKRVNLPLAWDVRTVGVTIAILDSGIYPHSDLWIVPGWNLVDNNSDTSDVRGHGTGVAGLAGAIGNNGIGVAGAAWTTVMPVRISNADGSSTFSLLSQGLVYAADRGVLVANVSFSNTHMSLTFSEACAYFQSKGGVVVVSSGNNSSYENSPDNPYMLRVGATDASNQIASFSTYGPSVDLVAPGVNVRTTFRGNLYGNGSGTSFSSPIVAGICALLIAEGQNPNVLKTTAKDLGLPGRDDHYGYGLVDAYRALTAPVEPGPPPDTQAPFVAITSPQDGSTVKGSVNVKVSASDNVGVSRVQIWLNGTLRGTLSAEPYTLNVSAKQFSRGENVILATARDSSGNEASHSVRVFRA